MGDLSFYAALALIVKATTWIQSTMGTHQQ